MYIKRFRELREEMGLSQADVAGMLNVHRVTVCRLENGRQGARPLTIEAIEQLFASLEQSKKMETTAESHGQ